MASPSVALGVAAAAMTRCVAHTRRGRRGSPGGYLADERDHGSSDRVPFAVVGVQQQRGRSEPLLVEVANAAELQDEGEIVALGVAGEL